tara:strand:- start:279 stop:383 length:105 start_codon:yes stop_codon:yes gene_type:complete
MKGTGMADKVTIPRPQNDASATRGELTKELGAAV